MANYKWDNPHDWLMEKLSVAKAIEHERMMEKILQFVDFDTIQNAFQDEMDEDGYFKELKNE